MNFYQDNENPNQGYGEIKDPKSHIKESIKMINKATDKLKDRNVVGKQREDLSKARRDLLKNLVQLVAGAIQAQVIPNDEYKVLTAKVDKKHFKDSGRINSMLKEIIDELSAKQADRTLTDIQIAKLIETPYQLKDIEGNSRFSKIDPKEFNDRGVQEVPEDVVPEVNEETVIEVESNHANDERIVVDKEEKVAFIFKGKKIFAKDLGSDNTDAKGWFGTALDMLTSAFGYVWRKLLEVATALIQAVMIALVALYVLIENIVGFGVDCTTSGWNKFTSLFKRKKETPEETLRAKHGLPYVEPVTL